MPEICRVSLINAQQQPLLEAVAIGDPEVTIEQLADTAERFDLVDDIENAAAAVLVACRVCGCTEDRACPGGCSWVPGEPDLCTCCRLADSAAPRRLVLP